jgi:L-asparagine transporter-like permease
MVAAVPVAILFPRSAYLYMLGVAFFGGLFVWWLILVTHLRFRQRYTETLVYRAPGFPVTTWCGLIGLSLITLSTWWVPDLHITLLTGLPWLAFISLCYFVWVRLGRRASAGNSIGQSSRSGNVEDKERADG